MYQSIANKAIRRFVTAILCLFLGAETIFAAELTIKEAGLLAIKNDYTLQAISARGLSMSELSIAAEKLPDPTRSSNWVLPTCPLTPLTWVRSL